MINPILPNHKVQYYKKQQIIYNNTNFKGLLDSRVLKVDNNSNDPQVVKVRRSYNALLFSLTGICMLLIGLNLFKK